MAQGNGAWTDLISEFMLYTQDYQSPEIFRLWSAITLVGGACERRVWLELGPYDIYPNLYVFLVAPPGHGKSIIGEVRSLWTQTKDPDHGTGNGQLKDAFYLAPINASRASLVDNLDEAKQVRILQKANPLRSQGEASLIYHSLLVPAEEFEALLPIYDSGFMSLLNVIWTNPAMHRETRRHGPAKDVSIPNPQFTILGGVQPAYFVSHFPDVAWDTGLARRIVMIYSDTVVEIDDPFFKREGLGKHREHILHRLGYISTLYGRMRISKDAQELITKWNKEGRKPVPAHSKLAHYNTTRLQFLGKLSVIAGMSRTGELLVQTEDVVRALGWLLEAERRMPDIFRAMTGKSDSQILEELHIYLSFKYREGGKNQPVDSKFLYEFLSYRATSDKIQGLMTMAEKTSMMSRVLIMGTDHWIPKARFRHGVE